MLAPVTPIPRVLTNSARAAAASAVAPVYEPIAPLADIRDRQLGLYDGVASEEPQRQRAALVAGPHGVTHGGLDPVLQGHRLIGGGRHRSLSVRPEARWNLTGASGGYSRVTLRFLASLRFRFTLGFS